VRTPDELKSIVEDELERLELWPELYGLAEPVRYAAVEMGGKRIRPVICLAVGEAVGSDPAHVLPAATALELVHNFSLVHDDLPSMDDDAERRGKASVWAAHGEGSALLAGDALLAEAFRLAASYRTPAVARELAEATLGMIGGQYLDTAAREDAGLETIHRLKTGRLFYASVTLALEAAEVPGSTQVAWRAFADELGMLFQVVDDILDGDGFVLTLGVDGARRLADAAAARARDALAGVDADTSVLEGIVDDLAVRTV
jgi:geranylgeranyl diphosphate synthase, type II